VAVELEEIEHFLGTDCRGSARILRRHRHSPKCSCVVPPPPESGQIFGFPDL
jgi:hypothetical protein